MHSMKLFLFVCCVFGATPVFSEAPETIHEHMTESERRDVFHSQYNDIPEYKVVPIKHTRLPRNAQYPVNANNFQPQVNIDAFNQNLRLYLRPSEGFLAAANTPMWTVRSDDDAPLGLLYEYVPNAMATLIGVYQDVQNNGALTIESTRDNHLLFDGVAGNNLVIRPLPQRIIHDVIYKDGRYYPHYRMNASDDGMVHTYHHVVYKRPTINGESYQDSLLQNPSVVHNLRSKRSAESIIYPQVLVLVDFSEYALLGRNLEQAKRYLIAFWNAVDLRYRMLTNPKVRFNIAGIIIALDEYATPYIENNRVDIASVDADLALYNMSEYFYEESRFPFSIYDFAVILTQLDMCNMDDFGYCDPSTLGYAFVAGACNRNSTSRSTEAVGIVEDNGGYSGIIPTAHEVGHLIGAHHDGSQHADDCPADDGYIMTSGLLMKNKGFQWSPCTLEAFSKFLSEDRAQCLYNVPPVAGAQAKRLLPGKTMTIDEQCKKVYGTRACHDNLDICTRLECEIPGSGLCRAIAPAAEGSSCGAGLICLNGQCILEGTETKNTGNSWSSWQEFNISPQRISPIIRYN